MTREISKPGITESRLSRIATVAEGGTSADNAKTAADNLGALSLLDLNKPTKPVKLSSSGKLDLGVMPSSVVLGSTLMIPNYVYAGSIAKLTITNYDMSVVYTASVTAGSVTIVKDTLYYAVPVALGSVTLTLNGVSRVLNVIENDALTPSILSPVDNSIDNDLNLSIVSSPFKLAVGAGTHEYSDWEIATDVDFNNVVGSSFNDTVNKTTWSLDSLITFSSYYVRVRYKDTVYGYTDWSDTVKITTGDGIPNTEQAKLLASDGAASDRFGWSVAMSDDSTRCIVGAYGKTGPAGSQQGATYVFTRSGVAWSQEAKLLASDGIGAAYFGRSVSMSGDGTRCAVGSISSSSNSSQGAVYIFVRNGSTWSQEAALLHSDPATSDQLGWSVAMSSDGVRCIAGAVTKTGPAGIGQGAVYIFARSGVVWSQEAKLTHSDPATHDQFGWSVAMSSDGSRCAVGAYYKTGPSGGAQGAAYIFTRSGVAWSQEAKLLASDGTANSIFGQSVSLSLDASRCAVGAEGMTGASGGNQGAAYIFTRSGVAWSQEAKLTHSDPVTNDQLGRSITLSSDGGKCAVGAYNKTGPAGKGQGAVYIFARSGVVWSQEAKLLASDPGTYDYFGNSVSLSSDGSKLAISSALKNGPGGTQQGAAYVFS